MDRGTSYCKECGCTKAKGYTAKTMYSTPPVSSGPIVAIGGVGADAPKCLGCGKNLGGMFKTALNGKWHEECFACITCKKPITDTKFAVKEGRPMCSSCQVADYKGLSTITSSTGTMPCAGCGGEITGKSILFETKYYHKGPPSCLKCAMCYKTIDTDTGFVTSGGKPFHNACAKKMNPDGDPDAYCLICKKEILGRFIKSSSGAYHAECFKCDQCGQALSGGYAERDGRNLCGNCARRPEPKVAVLQRTQPLLTTTSSGSSYSPQQTTKPISTTTSTSSGAKMCPECGANTSGKFCGECGHKF